MIIKSPKPDIAIPEIPLPELVLQQTARLADKPALIDSSSGRILTYGEFGKQVRAFAAGLAQRGLRKGEVFGIFMPNCIEYAIAFHGVVLAGGVNTTVNPLYTAAELAKQLNDCNARFLLTLPGFLETAQQATKLTAVEEVYVIGDVEGATPYATLLQPDLPVPKIEFDVRNDLVVQLRKPQPSAHGDALGVDDRVQPVPVRRGQRPPDLQRRSGAPAVQFGPGRGRSRRVRRDISP